MAFTPFFATGFEMGTRPQVNGVTYVDGGNVDGSYAHTGSYGLGLGSSYATHTYGIGFSAISEVYVGVWGKCSGNGYLEIRFNLSNGNYVRLYMWSSTLTSATLYLGEGTVLATGWQYNNMVWNLYTLRISSSIIEIKLNGLEYLTYSPGAGANITTVYLRGGGGAGGSGGTWDDFVVGTGGFPRDMRITLLRPNDDTATIQWDNSGASGENYTYVDDGTPNDSDYTHTTTNAEKDLFELTDFEATIGNNTYLPQFTIQWVRAWKEPANSQKIKLLQKLGTTEYSATAKDVTLTGNPTYIYDIRTTDPDGNPWADSNLDALQAGYEAVIPE